MFCLDVKRGVEALSDQLTDRRNIIQLLIRRIFVENLVRARYALIYKNMRSGFDSFLINREIQFLSQRRGAKPEFLSRLEFQRIIHHYFGKFLDRRSSPMDMSVSHSFSYTNKGS